ncbi:hypothetical protein BGX34_000782 [Mortierella sp. NVP85]|nr:hypothetical protein BGX34_000782 [Mortierella sp. NVP85]
MSPAKNPLELPELLERISRFLTLNDAVSCVRVCKAWSDIFVSVIWHTIDFAVHKNLHQMDTKVLAGYGHHIRIVKNMKEHNHIAALIVSNASKISRLSITMAATHELYAHLSDLLRRINTSVRHLDMAVARLPSGKTAPFFAVDSLFPTTNTGATSRLSCIKLQRLTMTRDAFSSLLKICPALTYLHIQNTTFQSWPIYDQSGTHWYQHPGITDLEASIDQVFKMNTQSKNPSSLLVHFPNLRRWHTWSTNGPVDSLMHHIRDEVAEHCPSLKRLYLQTDAPTAVNMLTEVSHNLTAVCILAQSFSVEVVMAIFRHHDTLDYVTTFASTGDFFDSETIPEVKKMDTDGWIVLFLPRHCAQLKTLHLPLFEMQMKDIEKTNWICHDLGSLRIRIQGLDTKEKVDRSLQLWRDERVAIRAKRESIIPASDNSIEARVARHLLKFKKLRDVWLGWKVWKVNVDLSDD